MMMPRPLCPSPNGGGVAQREVLILAADRSLRTSTAFALEVEGAKVRTFADEAAFLLAAQLPDVACLLIDHEPPALDALAIVRQVRRAGLELPVIVLAGAPGRLLRSTFNALRVKLVEKPLLCDAVTRAVRQIVPGAGRSVPE